MRTWAATMAVALVPAVAGAETLQSDSLEADLQRRPVSMSSQDGGTIRGQQVYVTMTRRDGRPIGADDLRGYVGFAEKAACQGRKVLVSLMVGAAKGAGRYEVLCAAGK